MLYDGKEQLQGWGWSSAVTFWNNVANLSHRGSCNHTNTRKLEVAIPDATWRIRPPADNVENRKHIWGWAKAYKTCTRLFSNYLTQCWILAPQKVNVKSLSEVKINCRRGQG